MKIALLTGSSPPLKCGVGDYTFRLGQELAKSHEVFILTSEGARVYSDRTFKVIPAVKSWHLEYFSSLYKKLKEIKPDIVHIQYPTQGFTGWLAFYVPLLCFFMRIPVVQTWHEFFQWKDKKYFSLFAWVPGGVVFVRPTYLQKSIWPIRWLAKTKKNIYIANGSTIPSSRLLPDEILKKRQQLLGNQARLIAFFGFIYPSKGLEQLFEIADSQTDQIIILGEINSDDPYHQKILALASEPLWKNKVIFTGFLENSDVADYLRCADAAVFPLKDGAGVWNTSLHAAKKNACPVLTTTQEASFDTDQASFVNIHQMGEFKSKLNQLIRAYPIADRINKSLSPTDEWLEIADKHSKLFKQVYESKFFKHIVF